MRGAIRSSASAMRSKGFASPAGHSHGARVETRLFPKPLRARLAMKCQLRRIDEQAGFT